MFLRGDLVHARAECHLALQQFSQGNGEWAWKFRLLEAEVATWEGLSQDVVGLLDSELPPDLAKTDLGVKRLMLQGLAQERLGRLYDADRKLEEAERLCESSRCDLSGELARIQGVVEIERGNLDSAESFFHKSLQIARQRDDTFLAATSSLNLGVVAMRKEHYDESVDWSYASHHAAQALDARQIEEKVLGNLGWAYYKMGDFEKSLALFEEARQRAVDLGIMIDQIRWLNNLGLVHYQTSELSVAEDYYHQALDLARKSGNKSEIVDALTELAFVSIDREQINAAAEYSNQALVLAHDMADRPAELYPLLAKGRIAAQRRDYALARQLYLEVARDPKSHISLKWQAQNSLARLSEERNLPREAEQQYHQALGVFEAMRSSLQHEDFKLPFSANAIHLYDDYVRFLVKQGRAAEALQAADYSRARTLAEGLDLGGKRSSAGRVKVEAQQLARQADAVILFYWLGSDRSYLWAVTPQEASLFQLPPAAEIGAAVERYRKALLGPRDVLEIAHADGIGLYNTLVSPAAGLLRRGSRVIIIPDGALDNLNFETLLVSQPKLHYWIEDVTVTNASSLRLLRRFQARGSRAAGKLLLIGDAVTPSREYGDLPQAATEMRKIAGHFPAARKVIFARDKATASAYLEGNPEQYSYIHFVAHGTASRLSPLDSAIVLSRASAEEDSFKLYARDIIQRPLHADLVTISTCYGAGTRPYTGEGLVGLSWSFLRAGAHNVIGALWQVSDTSTPNLMNAVYTELANGKSVDSALRSAKLSLLHSDSVFRKPFYWAPFQLYTGS
jgi:CHAT domain-containing protein/Tfp pilus assembly protein PilF